MKALVLAAIVLAPLYGQATLTGCAMIGADIATTGWAVSRGAVEGNPMYLSNGRISWPKVVGVGAGSCAGMLVAGKLVGRMSGERKARWARVLSTVVLAGVGVRGFAVAWNLRVGNKLGKKGER